MTRAEFLVRLDKALRGLPRSERDAAVNYYRSYFDDAGEENEWKVIDELGSPEEIAKEIIANVAARAVNSPDSAKKVTSVGKTIWLIILGIFAAPIALPIALALAAVVIALGISFFAVCIAIVIAVVAVAVSAVVYIVAAAGLLITSPAIGMFNLGVAICGLGVCILAFMLVIYIIKQLFRLVTKLFSKVFKAKGVKPDEQKG